MRIDLIFKNVVSTAMMAIGFLMILIAGCSVDVSTDYKRIFTVGIIGMFLAFLGKKFWEYE